MCLIKKFDCGPVSKSVLLTKVTCIIPIIENLLNSTPNANWYGELRSWEFHLIMREILVNSSAQSCWWLGPYFGGHVYLCVINVVNL